MKKNFLAMAATAALLCACGPVEPPAALLPVPEERQVEWQKMETYAFIHFGLNTFNDKEWGYGDTQPSTFNPTRLDTEQWVQTLKAAGMQGVILTAKHHDGFCLWPTPLTDYNISATPYKGGKGNLVGELAETCKKYGLKFGVYLSPWDRNHADYGNAAYVDYYKSQLTDLLTNYGDIFEVWLDGANGGDGWYGGAKENRQIDRRNYYDFPTIFQLIDTLQPKAITFSDGGPGCRWVGNEKGMAGATNWSFLRGDEVYPGYDKHATLTTGHADGDKWVAAECDVSIRPGWFYHAREDSLVKTPEQLVELYYQSVGHNATLLLNFPVDREGRINAIDSANAVTFHKIIESHFANDLLRGQEVKASKTRGEDYSAETLTDGNYDTYWATPDGVTEASLEFTFPAATKVNRLMLQEYIPLGQRVEEFNVEYKAGGEWKKIDCGEETTTVGYKRLLRFDTVEAEALRVNFVKARGPLCINRVGAFLAEDKVAE